MTDVEKIQIAFILGRAIEGVEEGGKTAMLILKAAELLVGANEGVQGWDVNGRPLK